MTSFKISLTCTLVDKIWISCNKSFTGCKNMQSTAGLTQKPPDACAAGKHRAICAPRLALTSQPTHCPRDSDAQLQAVLPGKNTGV